MRTSFLATCGVLVWLGSAAFSWAATCTVPSGSHPTIQAAVLDPGCSDINLQSQTYQENVSIGRSLSLIGVSSATTVIVGQIQINGAATVVALADLKVDASDPAVAGCFGDAIVSGGGAQVNGSGILVLNGTGGAECLLFGDGFESGTTAAWSVTAP